MITTILTIEPVTEYKVRDLINMCEEETFFEYLQDFDEKTENIEITIRKIPK